MSSVVLITTNFENKKREDFGIVTFLHRRSWSFLLWTLRFDNGDTNKHVAEE